MIWMTYSWIWDCVLSGASLVPWSMTNTVDSRSSELDTEWISWQSDWCKEAGCWLGINVFIGVVSWVVCFFLRILKRFGVLRFSPSLLTARFALGTGNKGTVFCRFEKQRHGCLTPTAVLLAGNISSSFACRHSFSSRFVRDGFQPNDKEANVST